MTLWGGRFAGSPDTLMRQFGDSIGFDQRLYEADIQGSIAYAAALKEVDLICAQEYDQLTVGLQQVENEFRSGTFQIMPDDEDIHTAVERRLTELIGTVAGKLHTGRSRNDQVATDLRLYLLNEIESLADALTKLQESIIDKAQSHLDVVMPGYTHMQQAQPVLFSHWLMSFFWKFKRDRQRLADTTLRTQICPLGSGAIAGNTLGIDRHTLAEELGFVAASDNSLDAVSDRDFVVEFLSWAALLQTHLSCLAEDLITWSSHEFGFVEIAEEYSTGSSLMPQKKNPDPLELMRAKGGRMIGHLTGLLTTLNGLPSGYNKDLQEDKEGLFDTIDTLKLELPVAAGIIGTLTVNSARMTSALDDALLATDLANYLVHNGVAFRKSHHLVGQAVKRAEELGVSMRDLSLTDYQNIHPTFCDDLYAVLDFRRSVNAHNTEGGTAAVAVRTQIEKAWTSLKSNPPSEEKEP